MLPVSNIQQPDQQEFLSVHKASPPPPFVFAFSLVTLTAQLSALLIVSSALFACPCKSWSKNQDSSHDHTSTHKSGKFTHRPQLVQQTIYPMRLVFNPGGSRLVVVLHKTFAPASRRHVATLPPLTTSPLLLAFKATIPSLSLLKQRYLFSKELDQGWSRF